MHQQNLDRKNKREIKNNAATIKKNKYINIFGGTTIIHVKNGIQNKRWAGIRCSEKRRHRLLEDQRGKTKVTLSVVPLGTLQNFTW
jgi:hypothetical protein